MGQFFQELGKLSPGVIAAIAALIGVAGTILAAVITAVIGKLIVGARDKQDREVEWRKHAIELTKLDLERKLKTRVPTDKNPIRPSILDFLANYRDLQELGEKTPKELYKLIMRQRITVPASSDNPASPDQEKVSGTASAED